MLGGSYYSLSLPLTIVIGWGSITTNQQCCGDSITAWQCSLMLGVIVLLLTTIEREDIAATYNNAVATYTNDGAYLNPTLQDTHRKAAPTIYFRSFKRVPLNYFHMLTTI